MKNPLQEAKRIEEDLVLQIENKNQYFERLEAEIILVRKKLDEKIVQTNFEYISITLDDILSIQAPLNDKIGLGYDKEKKPECFSFTFQYRDKISYVAALKSPTKKDSKKIAPSFHDKDRIYIMPKRPKVSRYQYIFFGY